MDRWIPIGSYRIGLDPLIGLIPGFGDMFGALISGVLIVNAHRAGIPRATVLRMLMNVAIDSALGAIPFFGDFFDFVWQSNSKNLALYRASVTGQHRAAQDWGFLAIVLLVLGLIVAVPILLFVWMIGKVFST